MTEFLDNVTDLSVAQIHVLILDVNGYDIGSFITHQ